MSFWAVLGFVVLAAFSCGAFAYAILLPRISLERKSEARREQFKGGSDDAATRRLARERSQEVAKRRRSIQASLKAVEQKGRREAAVTKPALEKRLAQAGLSMSPLAFRLVGVGVGVVAVPLFLVAGSGLPLALAASLFAGYALPRWFLNNRRKRRLALFTEEFANAVDVIVRGVKSGLPLNDTLRIVASEAREPVRSEFQRMVEAQQLGLSSAEAVQRLHQSVPMPETNFFAIVIAIQAQAGGNLSEALGNLSRVLRDRQKMKAKIAAMSMEAKASGAIIGALPPIVMLLVYVTTPDYIALLFTTTVGNIILAASAVWMMIGVVVMKRMIAFDF